LYQQKASIKKLFSKKKPRKSQNFRPKIFIAKPFLFLLKMYLKKLLCFLKIICPNFFNSLVLLNAIKINLFNSPLCLSPNPPLMVIITTNIKCLYHVIGITAILTFGIRAIHWQKNMFEAVKYFLSGRFQAHNF
jgi:hypothetical protein